MDRRVTVTREYLNWPRNRLKVRALQKGLGANDAPGKPFGDEKGGCVWIVLRPPGEPPAVERVLRGKLRLRRPAEGLISGGGSARSHYVCRAFVVAYLCRPTCSVGAYAKHSEKRLIRQLSEKSDSLVLQDSTNAL